MHKLLLQLKGHKRLQYFDELATAYSGYDRSSLPKMQFEHIQRLLAFAQDKSDYYKELFRTIGMVPSDFRDLSDLKKIPLLTKDIIQKRIRMICPPADNRKIIRTSTGGSTGKPINFCKDLAGDEWEIACMWHSWSTIGWRPNNKMAWFWGGPSEVNQGKTLWGKMKWRLGKKFLFDAFNATEAHMGEWYEVIRRHNIRNAIGYASTLDLFSKFILENNLPLRCDFVISTAEKLHDFQRRNIEAAFHCKLYNQYGCRENRIIAFECEFGNMHIRNDNVYVEFENEAESGLKKIVLTSLLNYGMPFIRYDTGDYGYPEYNECPCGSPFTLMKIEIGRVTDNFLSENGRIIHGEYFTHLMYGIDGVESFQFRQRDLHLLEILIVRNSLFNATTGKNIGEVAEKCRQVFNHKTEVKISYVDAIAKAQSGKHRFTISEVHTR